VAGFGQTATAGFGQTATAGFSDPRSLLCAAVMADVRVATRARMPPIRPKRRPMTTHPHSGIPQGSRPLFDLNTRARITHTEVPATVLTQSAGFDRENVVASTVQE
jgi:hypothetical protein